MKYIYHGVRGSRPASCNISSFSKIFTYVINELGFDTLQAIDKACKNKSKTKKVTSHQTHSSLFADEIQKRLQQKDTSYLGLGGNTPCIEVQNDELDESQIIFDLGSGTANIEIKNTTKVIHIFFTHLHYDHIQGLPFFTKLFDRNIKVIFYSPRQKFKDYVQYYMHYPYFPITMDTMTKKVTFQSLYDTPYIRINNMKIEWKATNHPGGCFAYKITDKQNNVFCYFSDVNITDTLFQASKENEMFFDNIDKMALDASMSFIDSVNKRYFGHSNFYKGVDFVTRWNIKSVDFFHHDPEHTINDLAVLQQSAVWYKHAINSSVDLHLAEESKWCEII